MEPHENWYYEDVGLFIGLLTLPNDEDPIEFFKREIQIGLFENFKKGLRRNFQHSETSDSFSEFNELLYAPRAYCIFGRFDLAVLSLVDDFEFAVRTFKPYSPLNPDKSQSNFQYQVNTCFSPNIIGQPHYSNLVSFWQHKLPYDYKNHPYSLPFIAICNLKINNSIVIGSGLNTLHCVEKGLYNLLKEYKKSNHSSENSRELRALILESFSWNEITIVLLGSSLKELGNITLQIKELTVEGLLNKIKKEDGTYDRNTKAMMDDSLLNQYLKHKPTSEGKNAYKSHVFVNASIQMGYDLKLKDTKDKIYHNWVKPIISRKRSSSNSTVQLHKRWFVKPGHLKTAYESVKAQYNTSTIEDSSSQRSDEIILTLGRGDFIYNRDYEINQDGIGFYENYLNQDIKKDEKKHIKQSFTSPEIHCNIDNLESVGDEHVYFNNFLASYGFQATDLDNIGNKLKELGVSKIISEEIVNIYSGFNDYISDSVLYGYYIELLKFLKQLQRTILDQNQDDEFRLNKFQGILQNALEVYHKAHLNRVNQSQRMVELSDSNVEYKGGIHQLLSAVDGTYKIVTGFLGDENSIAYVSAYPGISAYQFAIRLNYYHIFQPEFFLATATHEAGNYFLSKYEYTEDAKKVNALFTNGNFEKIQSKLQEQFKERESIDKDEELNIRNIIQKVFCDPKTYNYFITDLISFHFGFLGDYRLFLNWHWNYFMQMPTVHRNAQRLNWEDLISMYTRLKTFDSYQREQSKNLDEDWSQTSVFRKVLKEITDLTSTPKDEFNNFIVYVDDIIEDNRRYELFERWRETDMFFRSLFQSVCAECGVDLFRLKEESESLNQNDFNKGIPKYFDKTFVGQGSDNHDSESMLQIMKISYGYIKSIANGLDAGPNTILPRDTKGVVDVNSLKGKSNYMFDKRGGIFTVDPQVRRQIFQKRIAVIRSLWDLSSKRKYKAFKKKIEVDPKPPPSPKLGTKEKIQNHTWEAHSIKKGKLNEDEIVVHVSYGWNDEKSDIDREEIVNILEQSFSREYNYESSRYKFKFIRDKNTVKYLDDIDGFKNAIGESRNIILVISDKYLRSSHCMQEVLLINKNQNFKKRVYPIVLKSANINKAADRLNYQAYWEDEKALLNDAYNKIKDKSKTKNYRGELDILEKIRSFMDEFGHFLKQHNTYSAEVHVRNDFFDIKELMVKRHLARTDE